MPLSSDPAELIVSAVGGDRRALARLITIVEDDRPGVVLALQLAHAATQTGWRVGLTGAPGAGKSTLTDALIAELRERGDEVAVLAVDPSSPFSGGAVLGDRVRMQRHVGDRGVYVRSMASRGHLGGLAAAAPRALAILQAVGFPWLLVETVGVGQDEVEIVRAADTAVVVVTPGWGDAVQAAKAGILEIGDVFVVNKADRPGVEQTVADLRQMLSMDAERAWRPPVVTTVASEGTGVAELVTAIVSHRDHLLAGDGSGAVSVARRRYELEVALMEGFRRRAIAAMDGGDIVAGVESGEIDPWSAAEQLLDG